MEHYNLTREQAESIAEKMEDDTMFYDVKIVTHSKGIYVLAKFQTDTLQGTTEIHNNISEDNE